MKCWTPFVVFASLLLVVFAAYSNDDMRKLVAAKAKNGVIEVDEYNFEMFLEGRRDYHLVMYMASDSPQFNCVLCREFQPVFETVADSWLRAYPSGVSEDDADMYFLSAEFMTSKLLFQKLQLDSIPKVFHFPPTGPNEAKDAYLYNSDQFQFYAGDHTVLFKLWVSSINGKQFDIYEKVIYSKLFLNAALTFAVVMLLRKFSHYVVALLKSTFVWGSLSLVIILIFIAGYMFNQIRATPFVRENGDNVEYFAPSAQMQYGLETQVVSSLYGLLGIAFVFLVNKVSKIKHPKVQFFATVVVSALLYVLYSVYVFIFSHKYRGYPFTLLNIPSL